VRDHRWITDFALTCSQHSVHPAGFPHVIYDAVCGIHCPTGRQCSSWIREIHPTLHAPRRHQMLGGNLHILLEYDNTEELLELGHLQQSTPVWRQGLWKDMYRCE
jgi:hypothetical protein